MHGIWGSSSPNRVAFGWRHIPRAITRRARSRCRESTALESRGALPRWSPWPACPLLLFRGGHGGSLIANVRNTNQGLGPLATVHGDGLGSVVTRAGRGAGRGHFVQEVVEDLALPLGLDAG